MSIRLGMVMDPIGSINYKKDSSLAMLLEAQRRGWELLHIQQADLYLDGATPMASMQVLKVKADPDGWYELQPAQHRALTELDVILMRKDPPFDMHYIYSTYILEMAQQQGVLVVNDPASLRDANEKLFTLQFPQCTTPTLVSSQVGLLKAFLQQHHDIILKPLDTMGGASIFRVQENDPNLNVIIETLTEHGHNPIMAQKFIPEIREGDKRILLVNGEPVPYALARIPAKGETRGNLAAGGRGEGRPITDRDRWICEQLAPTLREKGLIFVGIDVIGDYLTEVNVTSPTCIRELDAQFGLNISAQLMDWIAQQLDKA